MGPGLADDDDDDFAEAREMLSPDLNDPNSQQPTTFDQNGNPIIVTDATDNKTLEFGSQLVTSNRRVRPEYVQYARVAKKVDVRKLKESLWRGMEFESIDLVCCISYSHRCPILFTLLKFYCAI